MKKAKTRYREQTERGGYLYPLETYRFHFDQREKNTPQMCVSYHWHPELEILLIQEGELAITIEGSEYPGTSGDIFFVNPEFLQHLTQSTRPDVGLSRPFMSLESVVLPAPLLPMTATNSPGSSANEISRTPALCRAPLSAAHGRSELAAPDTARSRHRACAPPGQSFPAPPTLSPAASAALKTRFAARRRLQNRPRFFAARAGVPYSKDTFSNSIAGITRPPPFRSKAALRQRALHCRTTRPERPAHPRPHRLPP